MKTSRSSITIKLLAGFGGLLVATFIIIISGLYASWAVESAALSNASSYRVLDNVDRAYGAVIDLANRSRAFILSDHDERRIKGYEDAAKF